MRLVEALLQKEVDELKEYKLQSRKSALLPKYQDEATIQNIDTLEAISEKERLEQQSIPKKVYGNVPPNSTQGGQGAPQKGFESYPEMYLSLKNKEAIGDPESKAILDKMFGKMLQETKQSGMPLNIGDLSGFSDLPLSQLLTENFRSKIKLSGVLE